MSDITPRGAAFADKATILANTRAVTALAHLLAAKGVISEREFEKVRHLHLHEFDALFADMHLPADVSATLEMQRSAIEAMWDYERKADVPDRAGGSTPR